jgi:hypothetical protein
MSSTSQHPSPFYKLLEGAVRRNLVYPVNADDQTLKSALALVDVRVLDHLIVTRSKVLSFAEEGFL